MRKSEFESIMEAQNWAGRSNIAFYGGSAMVEINESGATFRSQNQSALRSIEKIVGKKFKKINETTIQLRFDEEMKRPGWHVFNLKKGSENIKMLVTPNMIRLSIGSKGVDWDYLIDDDSGEVYNTVIKISGENKSKDGGEKIFKLIKAHLKKGVILSDSLNESEADFLMFEEMINEEMNEASGTVTFIRSWVHSSKTSIRFEFAFNGEKIECFIDAEGKYTPHLIDIDKLYDYSDLELPDVDLSSALKNYGIWRKKHYDGDFVIVERAKYEKEIKKNPDFVPTQDKKIYDSVIKQIVDETLKKYKPIAIQQSKSNADHEKERSELKAKVDSAKKILDQANKAAKAAQTAYDSLLKEFNNLPGGKRPGHPKFNR